MEIGIGIHGEPGAGACPRARPTRSSRCWSDPSWRPAVQAAATGDRVRQRHGRYAADRALRRLRRGSPRSWTSRHHGVAARWSATTSRQLDMAGCSITLLKMTTRCCPPVGRAGQHARSALGVKEYGGGHLSADEIVDYSWDPLDQSAAESRPRTMLTELDAPSATPTTASTWTAGCGGGGQDRDRGRQGHRRHLKTVGMTLVSTVGGAGGPLYGTFFLRGDRPRQAGELAGD